MRTRLRPWPASATPGGTLARQPDGAIPAIRILHHMRDDTETVRVQQLAILLRIKLP